MRDGKKDRSKVYQSFALVTQFGITMLVPIALCSFLGWYLDQRLGTEFLFVLLFFVGALAGFRNIFILARKVYENKDTPNTPSTITIVCMTKDIAYSNPKPWIA